MSLQHHTQLNKTDNTLNTTTVVAGGTTLNIVGVPTQKDPSTGAVMRDDATMLHVDGDITSLSGPGQGVAAIQDNTALTITAAKDVTVTDDILYKTPRHSPRRRIRFPEHPRTL